MTEVFCNSCEYKERDQDRLPCRACKGWGKKGVPPFYIEKTYETQTVSTQPHYMNLGIQPIEFMAKNMKPDEFIGHMKGCVTKYLYRQKGSEIEDYEKAAQYASWLAEYAKKGGITIPGKGFVEGRK